MARQAALPLRGSSSPAQAPGRLYPVAQRAGAVPRGYEEGARHYRVFGRSRGQAGFSAQEPAEVGRTFETTPGMDSAGLEDPVRHAGDLFGLLAARAAGHVEVGNLGEDL